ncbi:E3 ubiquitin-protein ligase, partial [Fusarium oxysporum f. sp. albedinis]
MGWFSDLHVHHPTHLSLFPLGNRFAKIAQSNTAKANRLTTALFLGLLDNITSCRGGLHDEVRGRDDER